MSVRAKFKVTSIKSFDYSEISKEIVLTPQKEIVLTPQYDESIPEDRRFNAATPSGEFRMTVNNPVAIEQLQLGKTFYIDLTEVA